MEYLLLRLLDHAAVKLNTTRDTFILDFIASDNPSVSDSDLLWSLRNDKEIAPELEDDSNMQEKEYDKTMTQGSLNENNEKMIFSRHSSF